MNGACTSVRAQVQRSACDKPYRYVTLPAPAFLGAKFAVKICVEHHIECSILQTCVKYHTCSAHCAEGTGRQNAASRCRGSTRSWPIMSDALGALFRADSWNFPVSSWPRRTVPALSVVCNSVPGPWPRCNFEGGQPLLQGLKDGQILRTISNITCSESHYASDDDKAPLEVGQVPT